MKWMFLFCLQGCTFYSSESLEIKLRFERQEDRPGAPGFLCVHKESGECEAFQNVTIKQILKETLSSVQICAEGRL